MANLLDRAKVIPGRANTRSKAPGALWPEGAGPHFQMGGQGCYAFLDDGNRYIDMSCALGAVSLGYGYHDKVAGLHTFGSGSLPYGIEIVAAERVLNSVAPWASYVRFVRTGSESLQGALMVARLATGRKKYARLWGSYHGWHWQFQFDAWPNCYEIEVGQHAEPAVFGDCAALIIEPPRFESFSDAWLASLIANAHQAGALVIVDEMIYGGRCSIGGLTNAAGLDADLACFGKALGNGKPVAFIVGKEALGEHGNRISGTYNGDAEALLSLCLTLEAYEEHGVVEHMYRMGQRLREGILGHLERGAGPDGTTLQGQPWHQRLDFPQPEMATTFTTEMMTRSIVWAPYATNVMLSHKEEHIDQVVTAVGESLAVLQRGQA